MILEIRHYTVKKGRREEFIQFFETYNRKALRDAGMLVFGPLRDVEDEDKVHWVRAFSSMEAREHLKETFYDGPVWKQQIEPLVMPMIERFDVELTETTTGFEDFRGSAALTGETS